MIEFAKYKENVDSTDKYGIKNVDVNKAVSYSGNVDILKKNQRQEEKERSQTLAAAIVGINNTAIPLPKKTEFFNTWTDIDALELYLNTKPTCYLILSKPGAGAYSLGEAISKKLNCIHICPRNILTDEINQKSSTGICIDFNIKNNKAILFETFLKMLKIKLESPAIKHRGYIISGFPLVTSNRSSQYLIHSINGEEAIAVTDDLLFDTIANLKKKKPKKPKEPESLTSISSAIEILGEAEEEVEAEPEPEELPEEEELKVELPTFLLNTCSDVIKPIKSYYSSKKTVLLQQLNDLFGLKLKPDIVIYLSCPDKDLIKRKSHKYIDYMNNQQTVEPFMAETPLEVRWPGRYTTNDYVSSVDSDIFKSKYCCRQPMNFEQESIEQMCNYKQDIFPYLEKKLKDFDPKCVIKLDARLPLDEIMHDILERLLMMPIMPVIIPEPLFMEEPPDDMEEFWNAVKEINVIRSGVAAFKRSASPWSERCPVELKNRISVKGNPKLAVNFTKYVYLCASLSNMISFCRNPRPYLKLKYLEPTCRIIVIGTKLSGKTMISECLSWLFDTPIINFIGLVQTEFKKKYDIYSKSVFPEIIAKVEDDRFAKWQNTEMERFANLDAWCKSTVKSLEYYTKLLKEYKQLTAHEQEVNKIEEAAQEETKDVEVKIKEKEKPLSTVFMNKFNTIRSFLSFLPFLDDVEKCKKSLSVKVIRQHAPINLITPKEKPTLPIFGDEDVIEAIAVYIVANQLETEIEPTMEEMIKALINEITSIDAECQKRTNLKEMYGKYIIDDFPSDTEYWRTLSESKYLPDYTVALIENRELEPELIEKYKDIENRLKNYQERFMLANDPLIKTKLQTKNSPVSKVLDIKIIVHDFVDNTSFGGINKEVRPDPWASFTEDIEKCKENLEGIKMKIEENCKCFIDVELENKSDIEVVEEVLLKLRKGYFLSCKVSEAEDLENADEVENPKDLMTYNSPQNFGETSIFCPISYYNYGVLWEGKPEFSINFDSKLYRFSKEKHLEMFQNDVTKYQAYNKPFKTLPPLRICVIGCIGSGKTTISKLLAKELGLMHIDFAQAINDLLLPKHFKRVGRRHENTFIDVPIDDDAVVEFQIDEENENVIDEIMSNETELRRMVFNYFERGTQLIPQLMQKVITKLWSQDPFSNTGFILDGYPRLPSDIEDMTACCCIPDLIIEIECSIDNALLRLSNNTYKTWKMQLSEAKENARKKLENERKNWLDFLSKRIVPKLIFEDILENMFFCSEPVKKLSTESVVLDANPSGSVIDAKSIQFYNEMIQEFPEPVDLSEWEKADAARDRIDGRIQSIYESNDENIQALKDVLTEQKIKTVSVDGNKPLINVTRLALSKLKFLRNRCQAFFEETLIIDPSIAEMLVLDGFCFLSKFNRMCPVYIFENPNAVQNIYRVYKSKDEVFTIIHRCYIYFICGKESVKKFRTNPLKYVKYSNKLWEFKQYPLRISVIGAPKSGRSSLSAKLAHRYGLLCLSRGIAVRNVLYSKHWTELGTKMKSTLTSGQCINPEHIMKAVQAMTMDHRTITNGFVFDGFPETAFEAMELNKDGIYPNIVFDISTDIKKVGENSQNEIYYGMLKRNPPYSRLFIENRYNKWNERSYNVREWIDNDYQNLYVLDGNKSKWQCLQDAVDVINDFIPKVHYYLTNVCTGVVPAHFMCISNDVFEKRMSNFKHMCPLCLSKNVLRQNLYPIDKKGVVQYNNEFYWICPEHMGMVLKRPHCYLKMQAVEIPELPVVVKTVHKSLVYEKGVCIVTYAEHLPAQKLVVGTNKYAASFKNNSYMFCSKECLEKFLAKPHLYFDIAVFKEVNIFTPLSLKTLPNIGYLEQTLGNLITEACCSINVHRPKYPGLSFQLSGLLHIALYLKTHNPLTDKTTLEMYIKASKFYNARCELLTHVGLFLRSMDNPFAKYPACCGKLKSQYGFGVVVKETTSRVPVPDERYDYLVEYHKPASKVPAFLNVVDIAGLVKGAAEGQGLGNAFLSHIKACDAIFNLCRAFDDEDVIHVDGDVNPVRDLETIGEELRLKDVEQLIANFEKLDRVVSRGGDKKMKPEYDALTRIKGVLVDEKKHIRFGDWSAADIEVLNKYLFLTSKPALYLVNLSEKDYIRKKNKWLPKLKEWIDKNDPGAPLIPFSGVLESKLMEMNPEERKAYLKEHNITSALEKIIVQGYKALNLEYFFTAGPDEVKAWTIQKGTKAPQAAGRIHTDFEKGFIMAEVMHYKDFKEEGSEAACKSAGKYRQQGRNYVVEDGDIIFFKFNAGAGLKDAKKK